MAVASCAHGSPMECGGVAAEALLVVASVTHDGNIHSEEHPKRSTTIRGNRPLGWVIEQTEGNGQTGGAATALAATTYGGPALLAAAMRPERSAHSHGRRERCVCGSPRSRRNPWRRRLGAMEIFAAAAHPSRRSSLLSSARLPYAASRRRAREKRCDGGGWRWPTPMSWRTAALRGDGGGNPGGPRGASPHV